MQTDKRTLPLWVAQEQQNQWKYQQGNGKAIPKHLSRNQGLRGTLEAGTGAGKTRASIMCMYAWYHMHSDGVVVFYIPAHLMQQTTTVMRSWMLSYGRFGGGYKEAVKGRKSTLYHTLLFIISKPLM